MSTPAFTRFLKYKIIPIIVKDLRPVLNEMIQYFTFANRGKIKKGLSREYGVSPYVAGKMLDHVIKAAQDSPKFEEKVIAGKQSFITKTTRAVKPYRSSKGKLKYTQGTYGIPQEWKTSLNTKFNERFKKHIDWTVPSQKTGKMPRPISTLLVLGHGVTGEQLAAVAQRGVAATGRIKAYSEHEWTKGENVAAAKETMARIGNLPQFINFNLKGIVDGHLDSKGGFKKEYMVALEVMCYDDNAGMASTEKLQYSTKLQEAILDYALEGESSPATVKMITDAIDSVVKGQKIKPIKIKASSFCPKLVNRH